MTTRWNLVVHGGSGQMRRASTTPEVDVGVRKALGQALDAGTQVLAAGGPALDAVEAAVRVLEDDPHFNAGRGAALALDGTVELDAAIMDGRDRAAGAVAGVTATRHPVSLARAVMERSPHVLLAGAGADAFAIEHAVEAADAAWLVTPERRRQLNELLASGAGAFDTGMKYGTVGAAALDAHGHLAAATSTGGVTGKRPGRIGDSPIVGAGTWADDRSCAISCTGAGEFFLRAGAAHAIAARVRHLGEGVEQAAAAVLDDIRAMGGTGGVIVAGADGELAWRFTTPGMYRGRASSGGERVVALYGDE